MEHLKNRRLTFVQWPSLVKLIGCLAMACLLTTIYSCRDDSDELKSEINEIQKQLDDATQDIKILTLQNILLNKRDANILLLEVKTEGSEFVLTFEDESSLKVDADLISEVVTDTKAWNAQFKFHDETSFKMDILGDSLRIGKDDIDLNPSGIAPLSAILNFTSKVDGKLEIKVHGQDGTGSDIIKHFEPFSKNHTIDILGLYPGYANKVTVTLTNQGGKPRKSETITIMTSPLPGTGHPTLEVAVKSTNVKQGFILFDFRTNHKPVIVDLYGKTRWILDINYNAIYGLQRLKNGNICFGTNLTSKIFEYDMMGRKVNEWSVLPQFEHVHHDVIELPSGNFIVTVDKVGANTIEDYIVELDRKTGSIKTIWDLNQILPKRTFFISDPVDWFHTNAVTYSPKDNTLIISGQRMGIVKVTWDNKLKWILSQPGGWPAEFEPYLLQASSPDFEWIWGQHAPMVMPNGNIFLFDNGFGRGFGAGDHFSRAVEFKITEGVIGGNVEAVWEYGRQRGTEMYSPIISDVDYLPESETRLITAGSLGFDINYQSSTSITSGFTTRPIKTRIIEVSQSKEVLFEMLVKSDVQTGSVYRSEKMPLYPQ